MCPMLFAGAEADGGNASFAHPVGCVGGEYPLAGSGGATITGLEGVFARLYVGVVLGSGPGGEDFLDGEDETGIAGFLVHRNGDFSKIGVGEGVKFV